MAKKTESKSKPAAPAKAKASAKPAAKKKPAATKAKKPETKVARPKAPAYTQEDVALRAYFISENRRSNGTPGDEHQDWIEAERQLAAESMRPAKTKKA